LEDVRCHPSDRLEACRQPCDYPFVARKKAKKKAKKKATKKKVTKNQATRTAPRESTGYSADDILRTLDTFGDEESLLETFITFVGETYALERARLRAWRTDATTVSR
jgi:hypothetical protein